MNPGEWKWAIGALAVPFLLVGALALLSWLGWL